MFCLVINSHETRMLQTTGPWGWPSEPGINSSMPTSMPSFPAAGPPHHIEEGIGHAKRELNTLLSAVQVGGQVCNTPL